MQGIMGVENPSAMDTAKVLERYVALIGIVMLTPTFLPEQDQAIRELVYAKYMKASHVYLVRLMGNMLILAAFLGSIFLCFAITNVNFRLQSFISEYLQKCFFRWTGIVLVWSL